MTKYFSSFLFLFSLLFFSFNGYSQLSIIESTYTNWNGETFDTYLIEGEYTVVQIDKNFVTQEQINDVETMSKIVDRIDSYYLFYKNFFGKEPVGGMPEYDFKSSVAFVAPSCGAACGLIGAKGIEVSPGMFTQIYGERKYMLNTNRIGIVGYEFGRNFFTMGGKLLFPYAPGTDDRNGGFAEGFASFTESAAFKEFVKTEPDEYTLFQESLFYYSQAHDAYRAYINDTLSNPYNTLAKERFIPDVNRNTWGFEIPAYFAQSILTGTYELFKSEEIFPKFFQYLDDRNEATTIEEALGNISYSFSKALNYDLSAYFLNVLKFNIDAEALNAIKSLPKTQNRLIPEKDELWFTTPYDTIPLNIRSINYLSEDEIYQLYVNDELISESKDGNNYLTYSILKNSNLVNLKIRLLDSSSNLIDEQSIVLRKRHNILLNDYYKDFYFSGNGNSRGHFIDNNFIGENFTKIEEWSYFEMPFPIKKDRELYIEGSIRNEKSNETNLIDSNGDNVINFYSLIAIGGSWGLDGTTRVGYDIGKDDSVSFYSVNANFNSSIFFNSSEANSREFLEQKIYLETVGVSTGTFKDVLFKDNTDIDGDGIVDFEDNCFEIYNPTQSDIDNDGIGDVCDDDIDGDGILNIDDNCPDTPNETQSDIDADGIGDVCDDDDNDGVMNDVDKCANTPVGTSVDANGCTLLASNNFTIEVIGETCPDKNNGQIIIEAQSSNSYKATVNGVDYEFTSNKTIENLTPGYYEICIVITDQTSPYCYNVTIAEGTTVSGKSSTTSSKTTVDILEGTAPYDVYVNGKSILRTMSSTFDINTKHGDLIEVKTDVLCEGVFSKTVQLFDIMKLYPNPTVGLFELAIPLNLNEVGIELYNYNSQLISKRTYPVSYGKVQLDLSNIAAGMYYVKVLSDIPVMLKIIKK